MGAPLKERILDLVDELLEDGSPADALERLEELMADLEAKRDGLRDDVANQAGA